MWQQTYNPLGHAWVSTLCAALPVVALLGSLALLRLRAHVAATIGLVTGFAVAILIFGMPVRDGARQCRLRRGVRTPADRLDRHSTSSFSISSRPTRGLFDDPPRQHHARDHGRAAAAPARRVLLRRVLRGRRGVRHAGRGHGRDCSSGWASAR